MKYILTVTLNPAIDKTVKVPAFTIGQEHREEALSLSAGGKGLNVSRTLKLLGIRTLATGIAGGSAGDFISGELDKEGISNDFLKTKRQTRTNLTVIDTCSGKITRVIERGPDVNASIFGSFKDKFGRLLKNASFVIFSGSNAYGLADDSYAELILMAKKKGVPAALDTSGKPLIAGLRAGPDIVKPNLEEAEYALGKKLDTVKKIKQAVMSLREKGAGMGLITMGAKGSVGYDGHELVYIALSPIEYVNDVGCGDAFLAAFIVSRIRGMSFAESLAAATRIGTLSALTEKPGAF